MLLNRRTAENISKTESALGGSNSLQTRGFRSKQIIESNVIMGSKFRDLAL